MSATDGADVVVAGAGAAGLAAAIAARDGGASVLVLEANHDVGGHAILTGGAIVMGGGSALQRRAGIEDSPDRLYADLVDHRNTHLRRSDRDLVRVFADESAATCDFLLANGVRFGDEAPMVMTGDEVPGPGSGLVARRFFAAGHDGGIAETINGSRGAGPVRALERSARAKGVRIQLGHRLTGIVRQPGGRVTAVRADGPAGSVTIGATRGVVIATGGHTSNVAFRRIFDPRLTAEYQVAGEPWTSQNADGERAAMDVGAGLWAVGLQTGEGTREDGARTIAKTDHIGCRWGYHGLKWKPASPVFAVARASGLTVRDFQDVILVNQTGRRFWNELDDSMAFINACLGPNGNLGRTGKANGGGPIWAIFDAGAVEREGWVTEPPYVDRDGWFFTAPTLAELAARIVNPHQHAPIAGAALEATVARWNQQVSEGQDGDFGRPLPASRDEALARRILRPPFHAAWATPILHDSVTGLHIDTSCRVLDWRGSVIPGLWCAGECAGGFSLHGLPRAFVFGRIAGREAASGPT